MNSFKKGKNVCTFCGEEISIDAKRCPYCGSIFSRERSLNNDDVQTERFYNDDSMKQNSNSDYSKGLIDNSINADMSAKDFINEEKFNEEMNGLFDNIPDNPVGGKSGLFDANIYNPVEEKLNSQPKEEEFIGSSTQIPQERISMQKPVMNNNIRPQRPPVRSTPDIRAHENPSLSNAMKVFLTSLSNFIPGLGQLIGVIMAIVFMNSEGDTDKRSFGLALLVNSIIVFVIWAISCCVFGMVASEI